MFLIFALLPRASGTPVLGKQRLLSHFSTSVALMSVADDRLIFASKVFVQQLRETLAGNVVSISHSISPLN